MTHHLDTLLSTSREWTALPRGSHVVQKAIEFLRHHFQIDAGFFSFDRAPRESGDYLRTNRRWFTAWGLAASDTEIQRAIGRSRGFATSVRTHAWYQAKDLPPVWSDIIENSGVKQAGLWPLHFDGNLVALFVLARKSDEMDDSEEISRCMGVIALVLEMVLQRRVAEELSIRDPLTGLFNRRGFLKQFDGVAAQVGELLTLAVLDVDEFKRVNDAHGHQAGDDLLVKVGEILTRRAEKYRGICARFGGDEFVILAYTGVRDVYRAASTISGWFTEAGIPVSAGCAVIGTDGHEYDACYQVADRRLYEMKAVRSR